jgi:hypothetical protein
MSHSDNVLWGLNFQCIYWYFYYTKLRVSALTYRNENILEATGLPFLRNLQDTYSIRKVRRVPYRRE